jgi:hypothetical protein
MASALLDQRGTWEATFSLIAESLRSAFQRGVPIKDESDASPNTLALRDAFHAFPVLTDVLLMDSGTPQPIEPRLFLEPRTVGGPVWTLVAYHLADPLAKGITFHGTRPLADLDSYFPLLTERFGIDIESFGESLRTLAFTGFWTSDSSEIVDFIPFDIRERPTEYGKYLAEMLFMEHHEGLVSRFKKAIDYKRLYDLRADPVLSLAELTKMDSTTALFVKLMDGKPPSLEERQADVADIQLIPKVPQDVQITFRRAKDAYIFGYFRYDFFTMAVHYASLTLEAAIKARWSATLPQTITVSRDSESKQMVFPSYTKITQLCRKERWGRGRQRVCVNGERFPRSSEMLLDWLVREGIVTKWERRLLQSGLNMRNQLSHVEHSSTDIPSAGKLQFSADLINKLFHSVGGDGKDVAPLFQAEPSVQKF